MQWQSVTIGFQTLRITGSLVKLFELVNYVTIMVTVCYKNDKGCYICMIGLKSS